jgi:hypothetical protein
VGEGHFNSYFYKKSKFYKVCNDSKRNVCFNIVVGFRNWNTKIQLTFIGFGFPIIDFINKMWAHLILILRKSKLWNNHEQIKIQMN